MGKYRYLIRSISCDFDDVVLLVNLQAEIGRRGSKHYQSHPGIEAREIKGKIELIIIDEIDYVTCLEKVT